MKVTMKKCYFSSHRWVMGLFFSIYIGSITNPLQAQIDFVKSDLNFNGFGSAPITTSLTFGPDGRLYVLEYPGTIYALTVERNASDDYIVTSKEAITGVKSIPNHDDDGTACSGSLGDCNNRESTGLTIGGTAANPILYVTSSDYRVGSGSGGGFGDVNLDTNSGVITRLTWTGSAWDVIDLVRGLPRSEENHATNGLELTTINGFDYLIVAQGGHANGGAPSVNFSLLCEYALSGAVLSVNLTTLEGMPVLNDNGRKYIYDLPTLDDPTRANVNGITDPDNASYNGVDVNDPWGGNDGLNQAILVPGGPVQVFSPGYRNPYDLVITESGAVYVTDNGANGGWGGLPLNEGSTTVTNAYDTNETGSSSASAASDGEFMNNLDHLQLITTNKDSYVFGSIYGGHPNPTRANPTGAGLYTAPENLGTVGAVFRTQKYDPDGSTLGSTTNVNVALPANWPPVQIANSVEGDWRGPGIINPDGPDDNAITTWATNTNGIDEYTASNFSGAMKGNLLAGTSQGTLRRVELMPDGTLKQFTPTFLAGIGGNALGVTCNGDSEIFPGTIWAGTLNGKIVVFEPIEIQALTFPFRINAGGPEVSHDGNLFEADHYFFNGQSYTNFSAQISELYQSERFDPQHTFDYKIPVPNGDYEVILHFAEIYWGATGGGAGGVGKRIFDVNIENVLVLDDYDIVADVGAETPVKKSFMVTVSDGELSLHFSALTITGGVNSPKVSAIEILSDLNVAPVAIASATPLNGDVPFNVSFTGNNSTDDVAVVSYLWDFKDGSATSSMANPVHTFSVGGTYAVELMVEDAGGLTSTTTVSIAANTPGNESPVAVLSANPLNGTIPFEVNFSGGSSTDDVAVTDYLWDFKDGSATVTDTNPSHTFTISGTYQVELTVEDAEGLTDTATITILASMVENKAPVAVINATPEYGSAPLEVVFNSSNSTDDVAVVSYLWDFDDGSATSTEIAPKHIFNQKGTYEVSLTVEDAEGLSTIQTITIIVTVETAEDVVSMLLINPAKDVAQVRITNIGLGRQTMVKYIYVHDATGRLLAVYNGKDVVVNGLYEIPIAMLSKGEIYYLGFELDKGNRIVFDLIVKN